MTDTGVRHPTPVSDAGGKNELSFLRHLAVGGRAGTHWRAPVVAMSDSAIFRLKVRALEKAEEHRARMDSSPSPLSPTKRPTSARNRTERGGSPSSEEDDGGAPVMEACVVDSAPDATDSFAFSSQGRSRPPDLAPGKSRMVFVKNTYEPDKSLQKIFDTTRQLPSKKTQTLDPNPNPKS